MINSVLDFLSKSSLLVLALLAPIKSTMIAAGVLIAVDLACGIWRAVKSGEPITSNGIRRTITKLVAYQMAIVTAFIMEKYMLDFIPVVKAVSGLIAITEAKSIFENLKVITGVDFLSLVLEKLQGKKEIDK